MNAYTVGLDVDVGRQQLILRNVLGLQSNEKH